MYNKFTKKILSIIGIQTKKDNKIINITYEEIKEDVEKTFNKELIFEKLSKIFPNGKSDLDTGTKALLQILNDNITREVAQNIYTKSSYIAYSAKFFTKERLVMHLETYCIQYFTMKQVDEFYNYLKIQFKR